MFPLMRNPKATLRRAKAGEIGYGLLSSDGVQSSPNVYPENAGMQIFWVLAIEAAA
jgi:hypothetical protein